MTKITLGLLVITTCLSLLSTAAEARTKTIDGPKSVTTSDLGSGR